MTLNKHLNIIELYIIIINSKSFTLKTESIIERELKNMLKKEVKLINNITERLE